MSLPSFPVVNPPIEREDAVNQILSSIAMEELGLSHILTLKERNCNIFWEPCPVSAALPPQSATCWPPMRASAVCWKPRRRTSSF